MTARPGSGKPQGTSAVWQKEETSSWVAPAIVSLHSSASSTNHSSTSRQHVLIHIVGDCELRLDYFGKTVVIIDLHVRNDYLE